VEAVNEQGKEEGRRMNEDGSSLVFYKVKIVW
jgi:hypothetical protein